jgi:hypothetical protein
VGRLAAAAVGRLAGSALSSVAAGSGMVDGLATVRGGYWSCHAGGRCVSSYDRQWFASQLFLASFA